MRFYAAVVILLLSACDPLSKSDALGLYDDDGDGWLTSWAASQGVDGPYDCDDADAAVFPGAVEVCNRVDDDCDGASDESAEDAASWYADADGDGYGDPNNEQLACSAPDLFVENDADCDDSDATVNPDTIWYFDGDGDGFGDAHSEAGAVGCTNPNPDEYVANDEDCDDSRGEISPDAVEAVDDGSDQDCDGGDACFRDADGDGYGAELIVASVDLDCTDDGESGTSQDCDDGRAATNPDVTETCNSVDDDCDGSVDDGVLSVFYADADEDGFGDPDAWLEQCESPGPGFVEAAGDCDDSAATVFPGALELAADGVDQDCDGGDSCYQDLDHDAIGSAVQQPSVDLLCDAVGESSVPTDCDDLRADVGPGIAESCDLADNDCDGVIDEGLSQTFYRDQDSDGYGDSSSTTIACAAPTGFEDVGGDCDDARADVSPIAAEVCDLTDNDCDGDVDESGGPTQYYGDADADGFGDPSVSTFACALPDGFQSNHDDCDDTNSDVSPAATELCDGLDNDCNSQIDDGVTFTFYEDRDIDGFGRASSTVEACNAPFRFVANSDDCDDMAFAIHRGASEQCNSLDDDCDGTVDEQAGTNYYYDGDGDLHGSSTSMQLCQPSAPWVTGPSDDCDDSNPEVYPSHGEVCDGFDNNCDNRIDENLNFSNRYLDVDADGYGTSTDVIAWCAVLPGRVDFAGDCDDSNLEANPGKSEAGGPACSDGFDNDCDGSVDDADSGCP